MDIEEIKNKRDGIVDCSLNEKPNDAAFYTLIGVAEVDWLITELDKKQDVDLQSVFAFQAGETSAAMRCAVIAEAHSYATSNAGYKIADEIRKEFDL